MSGVSAMHIELSVTELLASLNETLAAGGDAEHTQAALENEVMRYAKGLKIQGYPDPYIASVMASLAVTYAYALTRASVMAAEGADGKAPSEFLETLFQEML